MDVLDGSVEFAATCEAIIDPAATATLKLVGELDISAPLRCVRSTPSRRTTARVAVDLSELAFIDSSGLSLLLVLAAQVAEVELRDPSPIVRKVIGLTGLTSVFVVTPLLGIVALPLG